MLRCSIFIQIRIAKLECLSSGGPISLEIISFIRGCARSVPEQETPLSTRIPLTCRSFRFLRKNCSRLVFPAEWVLVDCPAGGSRSALSPISAPNIPPTRCDDIPHQSLVSVRLMMGTPNMIYDAVHELFTKRKILTGRMIRFIFYKMGPFIRSEIPISDTTSMVQPGIEIDIQEYEGVTRS